MSATIDYVCPACNAKPGEWCTQRGKRRLGGFHKARELATRGSKLNVQESVRLSGKRAKK